MFFDMSLALYTNYYAFTPQSNSILVIMEKER